MSDQDDLITISSRDLEAKIQAGTKEVIDRLLALFQEAAAQARLTDQQEVTLTNHVIQGILQLGQEHGVHPEPELIAEYDEAVAEARAAGLRI